MRFDKVLPVSSLSSYITHFIISENESAQTYKVFPSTALCIGFQYRGRLSVLQNGTENTLAISGITGLTDGFKVFKNTPATGTILVYFTETGVSHFSNLPVQELFNQSVGLEILFSKEHVAETEEKLVLAATDKERIRIVEQFLLKQLKERKEDRLVVEAVRLIYASKGAIRIKALTEQLFVSQSPLEKRFRRAVGTSPKKFAELVRFNSILGQAGQEKSLAELCYEHNFFDQAHFIKRFKQFTGDTPEHFRRSL